MLLHYWKKQAITVLQYYSIELLPTLFVMREAERGRRAHALSYVSSIKSLLKTPLLAQNNLR